MTQSFNTQSAALTIDASGLACPLPLLKAKQGLSRLSSGERLVLLATDPGSERDVKAFMKLSEHSLVAFCVADGTYQFLLEKGQKTNP